MPMNYKKLFARLKQQGITTYRIRQDAIIPQGTLQKLRRNECVTTDTLCTLCELLNCQPGDLMEFIPADDAEEDI